MIHRFTQNGVFVVLDVYSGAVHVVDRPFYEMVEDFGLLGLDGAIKKFGRIYAQETITDCYADFEELKDRGELFAFDDTPSVIPILEAREPVVKALCLHVAHDCNLKCRYCFAEEGEYGGARELMSLEVGKAALDFLIARSGKRRNLEVDFFGGEPLMNFEVVKQVVEYGRELEQLHNKVFRFTITTNGILLNDANMRFINEHMHNVVLSLDGRREVNDRMRPTASGSGSYDIVMSKFQKLADSRNQQNYYIRGTFTRHNLDFSADVLHMADSGFEQVSVEPVVGEGEYAITENDLPAICAEYEKLTTEMARRRNVGEGDFNFFHFNVDLTGGPCIAKRVTGCGAGTEYLAVAPDGTLYPCHQFVGNADYVLGSVSGGVNNAARVNEFAGCSVYTKPACQNCWCKFYCSGGCAANGFHTSGDINGVNHIACELQKKRTECAIILKALAQ